MLLSLLWRGGANCPEDDDPAPSKHPPLRLRLISVTLLSATVSLSTPLIHIHAGWRECWHVVIWAYVPIISVIVQLKIFLTGSGLPCTNLFLLYLTFFVTTHLEAVEKRKYRSFSLSRVKERGLFEAVAWTYSSCQRRFNCYRTKDLWSARETCALYWIYREDPSKIMHYAEQSMAEWQWFIFGCHFPRTALYYLNLFKSQFSIVCHKPIPAYSCFYMCANKRFSDRIPVGFTK